MGFMRYQRKQDERTAHACTHNLAGVPNGVTVSVADLIPGVPLREGSVISPTKRAFTTSSRRQK